MALLLVGEQGLMVGVSGRLLPVGVVVRLLPFVGDGGGDGLRGGGGSEEKGQRRGNGGAGKTPAHCNGAG